MKNIQDLMKKMNLSANFVNMTMHKFLLTLNWLLITTYFIWYTVILKKPNIYF